MKLAPFFVYAVLCVSELPAQQASTTVADSSIHIVSYLDLLPNQADAGRELLVQQVKVEHAHAGCVSAELLQEQGRYNHLMLVETWRDGAALDGYRGTPEYRQFRTSLQPTLASPLDERRASQIAPAQEHAAK